MASFTRSISVGLLIAIIIIEKCVQGTYTPEKCPGCPVYCMIQIYISDSNCRTIAYINIPVCLFTANLWIAKRPRNVHR